MSVKLYLALLALVIISGCASSQPDNGLAEIEEQANGDITRLTEWEYGRIYDEGGVRSDHLLGAGAVGPDGEEIGRIDNIILNEDNQIIALIAEVGGFWDIGDTHVAVPWDQATLAEDRVQIPVREDNLDQYSLFGEDSPVSPSDLQQTARLAEDVETGPRNWKLSSLLGDYVTLEDETGYGYVDEVIFSREGKIQAVVIESAGVPYAYPFYGYDYGWHPGYGAYRLPYGARDIGPMEPFDYERYRR